MAISPDAIDTAMQERKNSAAFPILTEDQIEFLKAYGKIERIPKGDDVWEAGQPNVCMFVVLEGEMDILEERNQRHIAKHTKGGFSGDIGILTGRMTLVKAEAATDLDVLVIAGDCVRSIVAERPEVGEIIMRAFLLRRSLLEQQEDVGILVVGSRYSPDTLRIREFLSRNRYPEVWQDPERDPDTAVTLREFDVTEKDTPIVVLPDGKLLKVPTNEQLAAALGLKHSVETKFYDLVVVGAGPAGLAAAVYGGSEGLKTLVLDDNGPGGQAGTSSLIENYMGFPLGLSGKDLSDRAVAQAEKFGAEIMAAANAKSLTCNKQGGHDLSAEGVGTVTAKCVILATGAKYRKLDIPDLEKFEGRGIYYAATNVERVLCTDNAVSVVGAGNSAGQAAVYLAQNTKHVFLVVRGSDLRKNMSSYLAARIEASDDITVLLNSEICAIEGEERVETVAIVDRKSGKYRKEAVAAVFVMIGAIPLTDWLPEKIACDEKGFILTGQELVQRGLWTEKRPPFFLECSCPGVFAAGDVRCGSVKRVASAVGEGSMAVAFVHQFLAL